MHDYLLLFQCHCSNRLNEQTQVGTVRGRNYREAHEATVRELKKVGITKIDPFDPHMSELVVPTGWIGVGVFGLCRIDRLGSARSKKRLAQIHKRIMAAVS